jgi:hypothetical protein
LSEIVDVPKQAFLGLVEGFLSGNYQLYLIVEEMAEKKTFSCKEKGCGKPFDAYPPDDEHVVPRLESAEGAVDRTYKCPEGHENTIFWFKGTGRMFRSTGR